MQWIETIEKLEALYGTPSEAARIKVMPALTKAYRQFVEKSRFVVLTTVGPEGTDGSPRGDEGPVVQILDERHLLLPDWKGNDRIDSLRNILRDPRVSLLFLISQSNIALRVNGKARLTADPEMLNRFERAQKRPRSVAVIQIEEVYSQCARALMRSNLWAAEPTQGLPSIGEMLSEITSGDFDGQTYDAQWPERAAKTMW